MSRGQTLAELARLTGATLVGDENYLIEGVGNLEEAGPHEASFLDNPRYAQKLRASTAGVVCVREGVERPEGKNYLLTPSPTLTFQKLIELFIEPARSGFVGVHPTAVIHPDAELGEGVSVGPYTAIDRGVKVGSGTEIGAHVTIGPEVVIGKNCLLHPQVTVRERCQLGDRVILQPGAVIGSCGYGYHTDMETGKHHHLKHRGIVILEDDVEVGANTTIDRARFKTTCVRQGTKIDNLVQIGHQVDVGEDNLIVSQTGIAGSSKTGRNVVMAGQVGVVGHIEITDGVILTARSAVIKSIKEPGIYTGTPAAPIKEYKLQMVHLRNISKIVDRLKTLEKNHQG